MKVLTLIGTRPEAVKLAPVLHELNRRSGVASQVCVTGQHRELLDPFLKLFEIRPDVNLDVMTPDQTLCALTARLLEGLDGVLAKLKPDWILVQGDTTTVLAGALSGYYHNVNIGHVEAGLRSRDLRQPFPEEGNRLLADHLSTLLFAPTERAKAALLGEGVLEQRVHVTGNTVIDALNWMRERLPKQPNPEWKLPELDPRRHLILVTGHRRESFGQGLEQICKGLKLIVQRHKNVEIVYPLHPNPNVLKPVNKLLGGQARVHLIEPLGYAAFVYLLKQARIALTDSGGVQEEAPALNVPVLVMRNVTERPEGVEAGVARLTGTDACAISDAVGYLLHNRFAYQRMRAAANPYGDGQAARRIVDLLLR